MTLWRYEAVPVSGGARTRGHLDGENAAEVRAMLRRLELVPLELAPARRRSRERRVGGLRGLRSMFDRHHRARRRTVLADLLDGVATLLRTGTPLVEAWEVQASSAPVAKARVLSAELASRVRQGDSLSDAVAAEKAWFDAVDAGVVAAAEVTGTLPKVLERLSERHRRAEQLGSKVVGALAYPALVGGVAVGVWLFLSTKTLPPLLGVLEEAEVQPPALSVAVSAAGQRVVAWLPAICLIGGAVGVLALAVAAHAARTERGASALASFTPRAIRRSQLAGLTRQLSALTGVGVPIVRAMETAADSVASPSLRGALRRSCERVLEGQPLSIALGPKRWFDTEFRQLVSVGEESGELAPTLERAAERYERQAQRLVDRLAAALEPAAILMLAALIGVVVMAAVLPMLKLQEVLG